MRTPVTPPRWILVLLGWAAGSLRDDVEGDLHEWTARWSDGSGPRRARLRATVVGLAMVPRLLVESLRRDGMRIPASSIDLRLALRLLLRQPGLSLTSVLALAVTMTMATTAWTVASQAVWGDLDVAGADRLFVTRMIDTRSGGNGYATFAEIDRMRQAPSVEVLSAFTLLGLNIGEAGALAQETSASRVDGYAFALSGGRAALGRLIDAEDIRLDRDVLVLSHSLWRARFAADPDIVGRSLIVDGQPHEVIGVAEEGFRFPVNQDAWVPLVIAPTSRLADGFPGLRLVGRHTVGSSRSDVDAEFARAISDLATSDRMIRPESVPYTSGFMSRGADVVFMGLVLALLGLVAVAAANVANLILARTEARTAELAVRTALGASRGRIVGQLFFEVLVLTGLAALLGLTGAATALGWLDSLIVELPYWIDLGVTLPVLAFSVVLAIGAAVLAGAWPAFRATGSGMSDGLRRVRSHGFGRFSGAVIVAELTVTVGLLAGSVAMGRALLGYQSVDFGLPENEVLTAQISVPVALSENEDRGDRLREEVARLRSTLREELGAIPSVRQVGFSTSLPGEGAAPTYRIQIAGSEEIREVLSFTAEPEFYEVMDVRPLAGRLLAPAFGRENAPREVLVNQPFVDQVLGGRNPIGQQIRFVYGEEFGEWSEVVGLIPDIGVNPGDLSRAAAVHRPLTTSNFLNVSIRTGGDPGAVAAPLREAVQTFNPTARLSRVALLSRVGWEARALLQGLGGGLLLMGLMALLLSSAGLWAILAFSVSRRTREIGVRVALGATPWEVFRSVAPRTAVQVTAGVLLGCGLGWSLLQGTAMLPIAVPQSTGVYLGIPTLALVAAAVLATLRPIRRALRIRPADALREE